MKWFINLKIRRKLMLSFVVVLILAVGAGSFAIKGMTNLDNNYSNAMELSHTSINHIVAATDHYAKSMIIISEIFYPDNNRETLTVLSSELNKELDMVAAELNSVYVMTTDEIKMEIDAILPQIEQYRKDSQATISLLLAVNNISLNNPDYRTALSVAEGKTTEVKDSYANAMSDKIEGLSGLTQEALDVVANDLGEKANHVKLIVIGLFVFLAVFTVCVANFIAERISKPLIPFAKFMKTAGTTGELTFTAEDYAAIKNYAQDEDEIGLALSGSAAFINHVKLVSKQLDAITHGDLSVGIKILSDKDEMGRSLQRMIDSLNKMFEEIQSTSSTVTMASRHISEGAQTLAEGSTEQSATTEELSAYIGEIAQKTMENAETADKTAVLSGTIKEKAEKSSRQMEEMIAAVRDINEASQEISDIIKTIDDIAFQTNIIAINAAVEAARAGKYGKGFAVVAEEVRNLASKSAEAAQVTVEKINNSMRKAEKGSRIAGDTADSLSEIVSGINESNLLFEEIAKASESQLVDITHINLGIDQVAGVVQQNSATAQQSAAASEEMSAQAHVLEEMISKFKLSKA